MIRFILVLILAFAGLAQAATSWEFDWETLPTVPSDLAKGIWYQGNCFSKALGDPFNSVELSTKYKRTGSKSARLYTDSKYKNADGHNNCWSYLDTEKGSRIVDGVTVTYYKQRNEPKFAWFNDASNDFEKYQIGEERWFRYSFYLPSDEGTFNYWNTGPYADKGVMIMQLFANNNPANAGDQSHEIAFILSGGPKMKVERGYGTTSETFSSLGTFNLKKDAWNDVVFMHTSHSSNGKFKMWLNCVDWANCTPSIDFTGPTGFSKFLDRYWKGGNYEIHIPEYNRAIAQYIDSHRMAKRGTETDAQMLAYMADAFSGNSGTNRPVTSYVYTEDFQANLDIENPKNLLNKKCRSEQYNRVVDPLNPGGSNYVFKAFQQGDTGCDESGITRYRTQLTVGHNQDNGQPLYVKQNEHTWLSFKFMVDPSVLDGSGQTFMLAQQVGESAMMIVGNDTLRVIPERYRVWDGSNFGDLIENRVTDIPITKGQWYSVVLHLYKRTSTQQDGIYEMWLNGVKKIDLDGIITGSDQIAAGGGQTTFDFGPYHGTGARPGDTTYFFDDIKFTRGANAYNLFGVGDKPTKTPDFEVNGGDPITSEQSVIEFTSNTDNMIRGCTMGGTTQSDEKPVNYYFESKAGGRFSGVDTSGFSPSGVVKCFDVTYAGRPDISIQNFSNFNASDNEATGLSVWGYTKARKIVKTNAAGTVGYTTGTFAGGDVKYRSTQGDSILFDFIYSCSGSYCNNIYFDVYYSDIMSPYSAPPVLRMTGTAGALVWENTSADEHGTNIVVTNATLAPGLYRSTLSWTAKDTMTTVNYKTAHGYKSPAEQGDEFYLHEIIMYKNPVTTVLVDDVMYAVTDTQPPALSDCSISNNKTGDSYTASILCNADEIGGTDYAMITTSATVPSVADVKAGTGGIWSSQKPATTAEVDFDASGMTYQDLWAWIVRCDGATVPNCPLTPYGATFDDEVGPGQVKKFKWSVAGNNAIFCLNPNTLALNPFTGDMSVVITAGDYFVSGAETNKLLYAPEIHFINGEGEMTEADVDYAVGSLNALPLGAGQYNYWATDGECRVDNTITLIAE